MYQRSHSIDVRKAARLSYLLVNNEGRPTSSMITRVQSSGGQNLRKWFTKSAAWRHVLGRWGQKSSGEVHVGTQRLPRMGGFT